MEEKKRYSLAIRPLTGLHIGNGNALSKVDYFVRGDYYNVVDMEKLFIAISGHDDLYADYNGACNDMNPLRIQESLSRIISALPNGKDLVSYRVVCTSELKRTIAKDNSSSGFSINQYYRMPINEQLRPIIPGSSIKGALRTTILNAMMKDSPDLPKEKWDAWHDRLGRVENGYDEINKTKEYAKLGSDFSKELVKGKIDCDAAGLDSSQLKRMDDAKLDVMRFLEIADCRFAKKCEPDLFLAGKIINIGKPRNGRSEKKSMDMAAEVARGKTLGLDSLARGQLTINDAMAKLFDSPLCRYRFKDESFNSFNTAQRIAYWANDFAWRELQLESEVFYPETRSQSPAFGYVYNLAEKMQQSSDSFLLRLGRWSQCEYVTFSKAWRHPKTSKGKPFGTSRMLFEDDDNALYPLGWCLCTLSE